MSLQNPLLLKKYFSSYWLRSAFYTISQRFSIALFGVINLMVLIRSLSKAQMGVWAIFLVVTSIFETTKGGLLKNAHILYVSSSGADNPEKTAIASSSLLINAAMTGFFIILIYTCGNLFGRWEGAGDELGLMLRWFIPGLLIMIFFSHLEAVQQSHLDFKGVFAGYFVRQLAFLLVIVFHTLMHIPFSLERLALYWSGCVALGTIVIYFYSRKYLLNRFDPTLRWIKKIVGYGGYIFSSGIVANLFSNLDQLMTGSVIKSTADVASYNAASRLNQFIDMPSYAAADVIFPKVSRASTEEGGNKVLYLYERMVAILMCFTVPVVLFIIIFARLIITIIAGKAYLDAALILQLYMIAGFLRPFQNQSANLLNSLGRARLCFIINAISLAANLVINYSCLHAIGFYGAAVGTVITCLLGTVAWYIVMKRQVGVEMRSIIRYMGEFYKIFYRYGMELLDRARRVNPQL